MVTGFIERVVSSRKWYLHGKMKEVRKQDNWIARGRALKEREGKRRRSGLVCTPVGGHVDRMETVRKRGRDRAGVCKDFKF